MEEGFYKEVDNKWYYCKNKINGPNYELDINNHTTYTYPVDGWTYYPTAPQAYLDYMDSLDDSLNVDSNDPNGNGNYFKIYDYLTNDTISQKNIRNKYIAPHSLDYKKEVKQRLHPKYIFNEYGFLIECIYYSELITTLDSNGFTQYNYSNPILHYYANYEMHDNGYVNKRTVTRKWYLKDDTISDDSKVTESIMMAFVHVMRVREEGEI